MKLNIKSLAHVVKGAAFLGSGGGGKIETGTAFISEIFKSCENVELITFPLPKEIEDQLSCIVCDIGSISAIDNNQTDAIRTAFEILSRHFKFLGEIKAVFPIETGPENTLAPFVIAAQKGIPVIDGDGAGRAVPTLPLSSFSAQGTITHWRPICIANGLGDSMLVNCHLISEFDTILRHVSGTKEFHNSASLALWPDKVGIQAEKCVPGSISRALYCGQLLEGLSTNDNRLIEEALPKVNCLSGYLIGMGKVLSKHENEGGGFKFTTIRMANRLKDDTITVIAQNESLIAFSDVQYAPLSVAPDSICYLTTEFRPLTNVEIEEGEVIYLIGVRADEKLLLPKILNGFHKILRGLGYVSNLNIKQTNLKQLGDLFIELQNSGQPPKTDYMA